MTYIIHTCITFILYCFICWTHSRIVTIMMIIKSLSQYHLSYLFPKYLLSLVPLSAPATVHKSPWLLAFEVSAMRLQMKSAATQWPQLTYASWSWSTANPWIDKSDQCYLLPIMVNLFVFNRIALGPTDRQKKSSWWWINRMRLVLLGR